jgi:hypothetical protein
MRNPESPEQLTLGLERRRAQCRYLDAEIAALRDRKRVLSLEITEIEQELLILKNKEVTHDPRTAQTGEV